MLVLSKVWFLNLTASLHFSPSFLEFPKGSKLQTDVAAAKSLQSCPTLCNPRDGSPPDSPVPGILQARTLEWVAISFSDAWKWKVKGKLLSCVQLLATPWTAAHHAPPSMGFSRQEYWSGMPLPSPTNWCCYSSILMTSLLKRGYSCKDPVKTSIVKLFLEHWAVLCTQAFRILPITFTESFTKNH